MSWEAVYDRFATGFNRALKLADDDARTAQPIAPPLEFGPIANYTVVAGLGGRQILKSSLHAMFDRAVADELEALTFLDLDHDLVARELARERLERRSGPTAENILRDVGAVRATAT